ncbi:hypothetical protein [Desulfatibacillum aliphaticivorans]|uniref:hypothetical protein n=1 Tax=Desulfatibacillum aliphaticivorans TaxID=218208 RepID=UPI0003FF9276|nr:hypothetical protein [Desulfatibacillum aliphaticivorans]
MKSCLSVFSRFCAAAALAVLLFSGCMQRGYEITYTPEMPEAMPPTSDAKIFNYYDVNADKIYDVFFKDYLIIGRSSFEGPYNDPQSLLEFAQAKGAHVVVTSSSLSEERTHDMTIDMPATPSIPVVGGDSAGPSGYHTTGVTTHQRMRMNLKIFNQTALFLRKIKDEPALWEMNKAQFSDLAAAKAYAEYDAQGARVEAYKTDGRILGFYNGASSSEWKNGDLKFIIYEGDKLSGVYLMDDKTPQLAKYAFFSDGRVEASLPLVEERAILRQTGGVK